MDENRRATRITLLVAGAFFMEVLDGTIIVTALPQMAQSFHTSAVNLNLGITVYLLTLAVFIPVSGWVADRFGSRSVFASAIAIFTLASGLCGMSSSLGTFICMRVLQGVGGAMMVPVGRPIVLRITPRERLTQVLTLILWPGLSAFVIGPSLGGLILAYTSWHWIFFINLPLGAFALALAYLWVENVRSAEMSPFDWTTFVFGGAASAGAVYAMEQLGANASHWQMPLGIFALSLVCGLVATSLALRKPDHSLIAFDSLKHATYALAVGSANLFRIGVAGLPFLLTPMLQLVFGFSPLRAGLYLVIFFAGDVVMKAFVVRLIGNFGFRSVIIWSGLMTSATMAGCALVTSSTPFVVTVAILFLHGASRSLEFSAVGSIAFSDISEKTMGRANSFLMAAMQLSSGMGVAVGAVVLRGFAFAENAGTGIPSLRAFHLSIVSLAVLTLGPVVGGLRLGHDAGAAISGHTRREAVAEG
jgi:EmrB/QacA subfamily drug resistance transporter